MDPVLFEAELSIIPCSLPHKPYKGSSAGSPGKAGWSRVLSLPWLLSAAPLCTPWTHPCFSSRPHAAAGCDRGQQGVHGAERGAVWCADGLSLAASRHSVFRDPCHDIARTKDKPEWTCEGEKRLLFLLLQDFFFKCFIKILVINHSCNYFSSTLLPSFEFENPRTSWKRVEWGLSLNSNLIYPDDVTYTSGHND